jgi:hypothetical protein
MDAGRKSMTWSRSKNEKLTICSGCHRNMCLDPHRGTDRNPCGMHPNHSPRSARPGPERNVRQSTWFYQEHREQNEFTIEDVWFGLHTS